MSVRAQDIIDEWIVLASDPAGRRLTRDEGLPWLNQVSRDIARKLKCVEYTAYFNTLDTDAYLCPDDLVVETALWWSPSPSDPTTYRKLRELFKPEFEGMVNGSYPVGDPRAYYMRANFFHLVPMPTVESPLAGKIDYYGLPDPVASLSDTIKLSDYLRDAIREGMYVKSMEKLEEVDRGAYQQWLSSVDDNREDRSRDRRPNIALSNRWRGRGSV